MKKTIFIDSSDFLGSFKKLKTQLEQNLKKQNVELGEIVFTGSTILEWFKVIDRESQDLDILLYVDKSDIEDKMDLIDAIVHNFYESHVSLIFEKKDELEPENNKILDDGYKNSDLISIMIDGLKIDFILKPNEKFDEKYVIDVGGVLVSTSDEIFAYKAKFDKEGDKFKEDYFNFFKKFNNMIFEGFKPDKIEEETPTLKTDAILSDGGPY